MTTKIEISVKTLITITIFFLVVGMIYLIRDVLILLFITFILKSALSPLVDRLESKRLSRVFAILIVYIAALFIIGIVIAIVLPLFIGQIVTLINNFPIYLERISELTSHLAIQNKDFFASLSSEASTFSSGLFRVTLSVFSTVISIITVMVVTFYLLLDEHNLKTRLEGSLPQHLRHRVMTILADVEKRLGAWVRGQLVLSFIIGSLYVIGLTVLGVESPIALGLIGGLCEAIPVIGPIISAIPAFLIAFTKSPVLGLAVLALYFVVQQLEGHVVVPKVMQKATGLSPLVVLIAVLVGGRVYGAIGVLLAVPIAVVIQVILFDIWGIGSKEGAPQTLTKELHT